jgi:nucleoside 2-deoxyribosyltransferase
MRIWLAYKFRGRSIDEVQFRLASLKDLLVAKGHQVLIMAEDVQGWNFGPDSLSKAEAVRQALPLMAGCDLLLSLYESDEPSEGRGWEGGFFTGLGKPTVLAVHESVQNEFNEALFTENPANVTRSRLGLTPPSVIRYRSFADIAAKF